MKATPEHFTSWFVAGYQGNFLEGREGQVFFCYLLVSFPFLVLFLSVFDRKSDRDIELKHSDKLPYCHNNLLKG